MEMYATAILCIILNRVCDALDGAIARNSQVTDFGVFLDATLDYIFYAGVISVMDKSGIFTIFYRPVSVKIPYDYSGLMPSGSSSTTTSIWILW